MVKGIHITKNPPELEFANQQEAVTRYRSISSISLLLLLICITFNISTFLTLFPYAKQANSQFSIWFIITSVVPAVLFITAMILYTLPLIPKNKSSENNELIKGRDFIKITKELLLPTTLGYKINRKIRIISILVGIPIFVANIILIFIGMFLFML